MSGDLGRQTGQTLFLEDFPPHPGGWERGQKERVQEEEEETILVEAVKLVKLFHTLVG